MTLSIGQGLLAIWNDIRAGAEASFVEWHSREHMPERLSIPGFVRGRRLFGAEAAPRWVTLYDGQDPAVFESPAYLARLADPTPGTRAVLPSFLATERMIGETIAAAGLGTGGALAVLRLWGYDLSAMEADGMARAIAGSGPVAACAVVRSTGARQQTEEMRLRGGDLAAPDMVVLAELFTGRTVGDELPVALRQFGAGARRRRLDLHTPEYELGPLATGVTVDERP